MIDPYIQKYGRRLYGLCMTLCANQADAEDLYQETWLKVFRKISLYDPEREFEGWLTKICVNTYRDDLRKKKFSLIFDGFVSQESKDSALENAAIEPEPDYRDLHDAVNRLPEKLRMTIILYYFQELDVEQTAVALSIPAGTVKSRLNKAKKLLKVMAKYEIDL